MRQLAQCLRGLDKARRGAVGDGFAVCAEVPGRHDGPVGRFEPFQDLCEGLVGTTFVVAPVGLGHLLDDRLALIVLHRKVGQVHVQRILCVQAGAGQCDEQRRLRWHLGAGQAIIVLDKQYRSSSPRTSRHVEGLLKGTGQVSSALDVFRAMGGYFAHGAAAPFDLKAGARYCKAPRMVGC